MDPGYKGQPRARVLDVDNHNGVDPVAQEHAGPALSGRGELTATPPVGPSDGVQRAEQTSPPRHTGVTTFA